MKVNKQLQLLGKEKCIFKLIKVTTARHYDFSKRNQIQIELLVVMMKL